MQELFTIIGIDPGYERCGFAVLSRNTDGTEHLAYSSCFRTDATLPFEQRLLFVANEFERLIESYHAQACALEKVYFTTNQKTAMRVAEVRGALIYVASRRSLAVHEYGPNEVKVAVAGDGGASKKQVMAMVPRLIPIDKTIAFDDEYDAIAVALTASASLRNRY